MLELAVPPTANLYWRLGRDGKPHKTKTARDYQRATFVRAFSAGWRPIKAPRGVAVLFRWYRVNKAGGDLDNRLKVILDALEGTAYDNDRQICKIDAERFEDPDRPRVEIAVEEYQA
jgi:crossover junction endodeoxyribonuclease RusA